MAFTPLSRLLPQAVKQAGIERSVSATYVVEAAQTVIARMLGPERAAFVNVTSFKGNVLTVTVTAPAAAHALRGIATQWMKETNNALGSVRVKEMRVKREGF
jgi:hypothetical protein